MPHYSTHSYSKIAIKGNESTVEASSSDSETSKLEAAPASCGSSLPQEIIDVFFPIRISNEVRKATHSAGLENTGGISFLKRN